MKDLEPIAIGVLIGAAFANHNLPILIAAAVIGMVWIVACAWAS